MEISPEELNRQNDQLVDKWASDIKEKRLYEYESDQMMRTAIIAIARAREAGYLAKVARQENQAIQAQRHGT